jgi:hypothetical protein
MAPAHDVNTIQSRKDGTPSEVKLIIHHQCPGIELISPEHVGNGATCRLSPDQKVDTGSTMQAGFNIDLAQNESMGALMYRLHKKSTDKSDEEATWIRLFVIWKMNSAKEFRAGSFLIEHDKGQVWNSDMLMRLVKWYKLFNVQHDPIKETWLMHDSVVLMTSLNVSRESCYKLELTISETSVNENTWIPRYIGLNR